MGVLIATQLRLEVHVLDRMESGRKPDVVRALGATYHACHVTEVGFAPDVISECTGVGSVIQEAVNATRPGVVTSQLPAASPELLPLDEAAETARVEPALPLPGLLATAIAAYTGHSPRHTPRAHPSRSSSPGGRY